MSFGKFATPQEAIADLHNSLNVYEQEQKLVAIKKKAKELQVGDKLKLRPSASMGHALDAPVQNVEVAKISRESSSGGCRVTVWVVGEERPYACLRGSRQLTVN